MKQFRVSKVEKLKWKYQPTKICKTPAFVDLLLAAAFRYLLKWADYSGQSKYSRMWVGSNSFCFFIKIKECLKENQQLPYVRCHIINRQTKLCIVLIFFCQINCVFSLPFMSNGFIDFSWFFIILTETALSCKMAVISTETLNKYVYPFGWVC